MMAVRTGGNSIVFPHDFQSTAGNNGIASLASHGGTPFTILAQYHPAYSNNGSTTTSSTTTTATNRTTNQDAAESGGDDGDALGDMEEGTTTNHNADGNSHVLETDTAADSNTDRTPSA
jgi:hypothetical protein